MKSIHAFVFFLLMCGKLLYVKAHCMKLEVQNLLIKDMPKY